LAAASASASEADKVADRAGFLLGHAFRCGIATERLEASGRVVRQLITALAADDEEAQTAEDAFGLRFLQSAARGSAGPARQCAVVRREYAQMEQPHSLPRTAAAPESAPAPDRYRVTSPAK